MEEWEIAKYILADDELYGLITKHRRLVGKIRSIKGYLGLDLETMEISELLRRRKIISDIYNASYTLNYKSKEYSFLSLNTEKLLEVQKFVGLEFSRRAREHRLSHQMDSKQASKAARQKHAKESRSNSKCKNR